MAEKFDFKELLKSLKENILTHRMCISISSSLLMIAGYFKNAIDSKLQKGLIIFLVPFSGLMINQIIRWIFNKSQAKIDNPEIVNQGVKNALRNLLFLIPIVLFIFVLIYLRLSLGVNKFLENTENLQILFTYLIYIVLMTLFEGGRGLLQHLALRLVLWHHGYAPARYDLLLNYCTERLLLQRIGGRYRFMHKTLQDYFAAMELD